MTRVASNPESTLERKPVSFAVEPAFPPHIASNDSLTADPRGPTPLSARVRDCDNLVLRAVGRNISIRRSQPNEQRAR